MHAPSAATPPVAIVSPALSMVPIFLVRHDMRLPKQPDGLIVRFDRNVYPQLNRLRRKYCTYEMVGDAPEIMIGATYAVEEMIITCEAAYSDFPYEGGDFGCKVVASGHEDRWALVMDFDSVPCDPGEPYHEGLLKIRFEPGSSLD